MRTETLEGKALRVGDRELRPLVRVTSWARGGSTRDGASGGGGGFVRMRPLAILETVPEGTRRMAVPDIAGRAMRCMACASLLSFLFWMGAEVFSRLKGERDDGTE